MRKFSYKKRNLVKLGAYDKRELMLTLIRKTADGKIAWAKYGGDDLFLLRFGERYTFALKDICCFTICQCTVNGSARHELLIDMKGDITSTLYGFEEEGDPLLANLYNRIEEAHSLNTASSLICEVLNAL
jgi:hypothetical protein